MKVIPYTAIRIPDFSTLYIFGSALTSSDPNDLDVLVIYDPIECPPQDAYQLHREMVEDLEEFYGLPVHITLLTPSEESNVYFIQRTNAVFFEFGKIEIRQTGMGKHRVQRANAFKKQS